MTTKNSNVSLRRLFGLVRPFIWPILGGTFLMLLGTGMGLVAPKLAGRVVDTAISETSLHQLNQIVAGLLLIFAVAAALSYVQNYLFGVTSSRMLQDLRARVFDHLIRLGPDFYESRSVGELLSRLSTDLAVIQGALTGAIPAGIKALLQFLGAVVILFILQAKLTLVALMVFPPVVLGSVWFGKRMRKLATAQQDAVAASTGVAEEVFNGIRTVQYFGREFHESKRYNSSLAKLQNLLINNIRVSGGYSTLLSFAGSAAFIVVLWYGAHLIIEKQLSPGDLISFLLYSFSISTSLGTLGNLYVGYNSLKGASVRIFELLDIQPSIRDSSVAQPLIRPRGHLIFHNVHFRYPAEEKRTALNGIQLEIQPGEMVGLVGPSGAGKSTLFSMLYRFHDPSSGSISIDGVDLKSIRLKDLRESIGIVPQDIFLFSGTITDNIRYGKADATQDEVRAAAVAAGADEFIQKLPNGYEQILGSRGINLSTGQRQRIAIARAFLKNPTILLLDEATSALDPDSEDNVRQALSKLLNGRTTLVIAHRLVTARQASRILVMDQGQIIGSGTHASLCESNQIYRRYWELQAMKHEIAPLVSPLSVMPSANGRRLA
jgi:ATP-binding cassette, subfamily B, bacterial MsbA